MGTQMDQPQRRPLRTEVAKAKPKAAVQEEQVPAPKLDDVDDDASLSTTERLLARKRRRQEEKGE